MGVILTGLLDDGAAGMTAIKRSGGITVVQDPNEADHPDMPLSVLSNIDVDYVESLANMGRLFDKIIKTTEPEEQESPHDVKVEARIDHKLSSRIEDLIQFEKYVINCPDCGGGLFILQKENPVHYRCHIGHSFTDRELLIRVSEVIEEQSWYLLRLMEERRTLLLKFQRSDKEKGYGSSAANNLEKANEMEQHIDTLKQMLRGITIVQ
jgi:two-component system chemotaxis response regulator CheB